MDEHLNFNGGIGTDVLNFLPAQLPAEDHPLQSHGGAKLHPGQGMDGHLGGTVDGDMGRDLAAQLYHAQILDDKRVNIILGSMTDQLRRLLHLPVGDQGVQGQMDLHAPDMAVFHRVHQGLGGKVFRALTGVQIAHAQIHGIGAVLDRGTEGFH